MEVHCSQIIFLFLYSAVSSLNNMKSMEDSRRLEGEQNIRKTRSVDASVFTKEILDTNETESHVPQFAELFLATRKRQKRDVNGKIYRIRYKEYGCFQDNEDNRIFNKMLAINRDPSNPAFILPRLDWDNLEFTTKRLVKHCAEQAMKRGFHWIGIQYYGECWSGPDDSDLLTHQIPERECIGTKNVGHPCDKYVDNYCAGQKATSYVYKLDEVELLCPERIDVGYLIDSSISISELEFKRTLKFISAMTDLIMISPDDAHFAVMHFSTEFFIDASFGDERFHNEHYLMRHLKTIKKDYGYSYTRKALEYANEKVFCTKCGMRSDVPKVLFVFTDGFDSGDHRRSFKQIASSLKSKGVRIIAIAIGEKVNEKSLRAISSSKIVRLPGGKWTIYHFIIRFKDEYNIHTRARELALTACH